MKNYAIENDMVKHFQRMLITSFKLENRTFISPLFNFFLELVSQPAKLGIFLKAQYSPQKYFKNYVQSEIDDRREGDGNSLLGVAAKTMKLLGKTNFGYQIIDRSRHRTTKYLSDEKTHKAANEPLLKSLNTVDKDFYEVDLLKSTIEHRESIIVGFFQTAVCKAETAGGVLQFLAVLLAVLQVLVGKKNWRVEDGHRLTLLSTC